MNMEKDVIKFIVCTCIIAIASCKCPKTIKYSIKTLNDHYEYDTESFESEVISPKNAAFSVTLEEHVTMLCKHMLHITKETHHFYGWDGHIEEIEPGTFENQYLDGQLHLSNNSLRVIRKGTFKNISVTELNLSYNKITTIEEGAIEDLPHLSILHLSRNKIKHFNPNSVISTPNLLFFDMIYNEMEKLEEGHFGFMSKKRNVAVALGYNKLQEIHPKSFEGLDIFNLNLEYNQLKYIPKNIFSDNNFNELDISHNELIHLGDEFFKMNTTVLRNVELEENSFDEETNKKLEGFMAIIMENRKRDQQIHFF